MKNQFEFNFEGRTFIVAEDENYTEISVVLVNFDKRNRSVITPEFSYFEREKEEKREIITGLRKEILRNEIIIDQISDALRMYVSEDKIEELFKVNEPTLEK